MALPLDLSVLGVPGCYLNISPDAPVWFGPVQPVPLPIPVLPGLLGITTFWQAALVGDPGGRAVVTTRAASITLW